MGAKPRYPVGQGLSRDSSAAPHAFLKALAVDPLVRIRKEPEVARRWGAADIQEEIGEGFIGNDAGFVIEADGEVVGAI